MTVHHAAKSAFGRRQGPMRGWIQVHGRRYLPCTARNLSPRGALLELDHVPGRLPFKFRLVFEEKGMGFDCEVRQICPHGVSVLFASNPLASGFAKPDKPREGAKRIAERR